MTALIGKTQQARLKQIELELNGARAVQSALLPKSKSSMNIEVAVCCAPAGDIGGDICDVFEADHGRTAVVVGDVSGKGMAAGLLSCLLYGAVHTTSWTESALDHEDATERLNDLLRKKTSADRFASLFWGYYELETTTFKYVNAGHLPMLLIRKSKHQEIQIEHLREGGPVLGILEWGNYQQGSARVEEGDLLILFSDGILEAMNAAHDPFGEHRLLDSIRTHATGSPSEIQDAIQTALRAHMGGDDHPKTDDQTLMIARFRNVPSETVPDEVDEVAV